MTLRAWTIASVMAAALTVATPRAEPAPADAPAASSAREAVDQYVAHLTTTLHQDTPQQRGDAAQRLMQIATAAARQTISQTLSGPDKQAQLACAKAIADQASPDPAWVSSLVHLLGRDRTTTEAAALALARYDADPTAYEALIRFARTPTQPDRTLVIRALGQVVQKPVADFLVNLVGDATEGEAVRAAAADALVQLSGQKSIGPDAAGWTQWSNARQNAPDWRARVLAEQHAALQAGNDHAREELRQFKKDVHDLLLADYSRQTATDKPRALMGYLNSADPGFREIGADIVHETVAFGQPIAPETNARLIELTGDPNPDVRRAVAIALADLGDPLAANAIVVQLQIENEADIKVLLIQAIALRAVGGQGGDVLSVLEQLLGERSYRVAAAAADKLRALAPIISRNPPQAQEVRQELRRVLEQRTGPPGQPAVGPGIAEFRATLVAAIASLTTPTQGASLLNFYSGLLNQSESASTRANALGGLAQLGELSGDVISRELAPETEPDPSVRQAAARALGTIGSFNYIQKLDESTRGQEPDNGVRQAAADAFVAVLTAQSSSIQDLTNLADFYKQRKDIETEAIVLKALCDKLQAKAASLRDKSDQKDNLAAVENNLAIQEDSTGEAYLELKKPGDAIPYLSKALEYWQGSPERSVAPNALNNLVTNLLTAYLNSGRYQEAVRFGQNQIKVNPQFYQDLVGEAIVDKAAALIDKGDDASLRQARELLQAAIEMNPPLVRLPDLKGLYERLPRAPTTNP